MFFKPRNHMEFVHSCMVFGEKTLMISSQGNKKQRKQAALLALVLARLLLTRHDMPPELSEYFRQLAARPRKLLLRPGAAPATQPSQGQWEADGASQEAREPWLPVSGSWVWWYDRTTLVILCEDELARIFADAKTWFYEAAGVSQEPERDDLPRSVNQDFQRIFPATHLPKANRSFDLLASPSGSYFILFLGRLGD